MKNRAELKQTLYKKGGNTEDIKQAVINIYKENFSQLTDFANRYSDFSDLEKCFVAFEFVFRNFKYKEDPNGVQWIKTPNRLLHDKVGDCKSYTIFIASLLRLWNIEHILRFVSFSSKAIPTHVYPVAVVDGRQIAIDVVARKYNYEVPYTYRNDYHYNIQQTEQKIKGIIN